jgi:nicotinate phosphoribosyltransferase
LKLDTKSVCVYGQLNSAIVFPNEPLLSLSGPLNILQLIETTLLNLTNYPTLISTLCGKLRYNFQTNTTFIDYDSCFAQSPYGGLLGIKYSSIFDPYKTTNILFNRQNTDIRIFHFNEVELLSEESKVIVICLNLI